MDNTIINHLIIALSIIAATTGFYLLLYYLIKRRARKRERLLPKLFEKFLYYPGLLLVITGSITAVFPLFRNHINAPVYSGSLHALKILTIIAFGYLALQSLSVLRELAYRHYRKKNKEDFKFRKVKTEFHLIQRILNSLIIFITVTAILYTFPAIKNIGTTLLASAGVVGLILGFAAQKSIGTFFAGLQIAIAQPIRIGDVVVVGDSFGTISEINLTFVVLNVWDGKRVIIPINYFLEESFENWTRISPDVIGKVTVHADYTVPIEGIRKELNKILAQTSLWDKRAFGLLVTDADEKSIQLRATMSAKDSDDAWDLECLVREKLITFLQKNYPESLPTSRVLLNEENQIIQSNGESVNSNSWGRRKR